MSSCVLAELVSPVLREQFQRIQCKKNPCKKRDMIELLTADSTLELQLKSWKQVLNKSVRFAFKAQIYQKDSFVLEISEEKMFNYHKCRRTS